MAKKKVSKKMSKLKALEKKMEELNEQMRSEGQAAFNEAVKEVFDKYPLVEAFRWTQYTPYFNDGEPCVFGVNTDVDVKPLNPIPPPNGDEDGDLEDGWYKGWGSMPHEHRQLPMSSLVA